MTTSKYPSRAIIAVLSAFFAASFIDLVGTGIDEIKQETNLPGYVLQFIASAAFIWFFFLSVPAGLLQDQYGKKKMVTLSLIATSIGLFTPLFGKDFVTLLIAFSFVGIGNTVLQVAATPLLIAIVPPERSSSYLSLSQFIKSFGSLIAPFVAILFGKTIGDWRYALYSFGLIALLSALWIQSLAPDEARKKQQRASFSSCLRLLSHRFILRMVLCIFLIVGVDVAMNTNVSAILRANFQLADTEESVIQDASKLGKSLYFTTKMIGCFLGAILLRYFSSRHFLRWSSLLSLTFVLLLGLLPYIWATWILIALIGFGVSNIFPLIFSLSVEKMPTRSNELSGLMMMAIVGGATIPPLMGYVSDLLYPAAGAYVLVGCMTYIFWVSATLKTEKTEK